jgi:sarcosine oxidase, subunit beta
MMDLDCGGEHPVLGALYHAPGAVVRHDAVAWGYGRGADRRGVEIHQQTRVTGIRVEQGKVSGVETDRGFIKTGKVISMVAGSTPRVTDMVGHHHAHRHPPAAGLRHRAHEALARHHHRLRQPACVRVPVLPRRAGHGRRPGPAILHSTRSTLDFVEGLADQMLDLFPFLGNSKVMRQWAGMADMTPDFAPIMGRTAVDGFYIDAGWGTWGFKATPISGKTMAWTVANDRDHALIEPFSLARFDRFELVGERGAASVGH